MSGSWLSLKVRAVSRGKASPGLPVAHAKYVLRNAAAGSIFESRDGSAHPLDRDAALSAWLPMLTEAEDRERCGPQRGGQICLKGHFSIPNDFNDKAVAETLARISERLSTFDPARPVPVLVVEHKNDDDNKHAHFVLIPRGPDGKKTRAFADRSMPRHLRELLSAEINRTREARGLAGRIDPRSYREQGLAVVPKIHEGHSPKGAKARRTWEERKKHNEDVAAHRRALAAALLLLSPAEAHEKGLRARRSRRDSSPFFIVPPGIYVPAPPDFAAAHDALARHQVEAARAERRETLDQWRVLLAGKSARSLARGGVRAVVSRRDGKRLLVVDAKEDSGEPVFLAADRLGLTREHADLFRRQWNLALRRRVLLGLVRGFGIAVRVALALFRLSDAAGSTGGSAAVRRRGVGR